ncbi:MAG: NTP transferase domain-containing protein [Negativicutes bacterium]|nr:NTP transferase domain-containing protein [Negativicutes bacterium]
MSKDSRFAALILAAGYSSRAPGFKPLLPLGERTVIEAAITSFRQAGIGDIMVVVGHRADELLPVLANLEARPVLNEWCDKGMFSSVVTGVRALRPEVEAFFLLPADMPLIRSHTIRLLVRAHKMLGADVNYPVFQGRRGHPPLISSRLLPAILAWNRPEGLRPLLEQYESKAYEVDVLDEGVLMDIDTPQDYHMVGECYSRRYLPTRNECEAIMTKMTVPDMVARHGRLVAEVAWGLAEQLNQISPGLDANLVMAAGLLHDLAKGKPDHASRGARMLRRLGYPRVAEIVACHTDIVWQDNQLLNEAAIVYLADKLVLKDRIVSIEERFQCSLAKFAADEDALLAIRGRQEKTQAIIKKIEQLLGLDLAAAIAAETKSRRLPWEGR